MVVRRDAEVGCDRGAPEENDSEDGQQRHHLALFSAPSDPTTAWIHSIVRFEGNSHAGPVMVHGSIAYVTDVLIVLRPGAV